MTFGDGLQTIGERAFEGCQALTSVTLPEGVTSLGEGAFTLCGKLAEVSLPESLTEIGDRAFPGDHELKITLTKGSVADSRVDELAGSEYFRKNYR